MLDALTTLVVAALSLLAMAGLVWAASGGRDRPGVGWWCVGSACAGGAVILFGLRHSMPVFVGLHVANTLALSSALCWTQSLRVLDGRGWTGPRMAGSVLLALAACSAAQEFSPRMGEVGLWLALGALEMAAALAAARLARHARSPNAAAIAVAQGALGLMFWLLPGAGGGFGDPASPSGNARDGGLLAVAGIVATAIGHLCFTGLVLDLQARAWRVAARARWEAEESARLDPDVRRGERQRQALLILGALAHELNQPLTVALTQAQLAQRRLKAGKAEVAVMRELMDRAEAALQRTSAILDRIRTGAGPDIQALTRLDLRRVAADVLALMALEWQGGNVLVVQSVAGPALWCRGDPVALAQVLVNLMRNAANAMRGQRGGLIEVRCEAREGQAVIVVRDHGPGLPAALLERWGQPFIGGAQTGAGLGLGLAISRSIVAEHGGTLELRNGPGGGAEATLALPAVAPGEDPA